MNKKFKIAATAVSVVMAGSMAFGMFGCTTTPNNPGDTNKPNETDIQAAQITQAVKDKLNYNTYVGACDLAYERLVSKNWAEGSEKQAKLTVTAPTSSDTISLRFNIGDKNVRSISYIEDAKMLTGTVTLPDGSSVNGGALKPVWSTLQSIMSEKTGATVTFVDRYRNDSNKVKIASTGIDKESNPLSDYDLITDGVGNITDNQAKLLDLSQYLDQMPNYAAFLTANPTVKDSLTFNGDAMYYAPYFDGYNDVEKYSIFKLNWVESLLDATAGDATQTWAASMTAKGKTAAATAAAIKSYMGTTGSWNTDVLDKDGNKVNGGITVNYDKALAAAKGTDGLGAAISDAAGVAYDGESGNIVDILNFIINTKEGDVTGAKLLKVVQEYIKVAYYVGTSNTAFYTQSGYKLSDVFNGYSAAWDVDLFAALGRVMITNPSLLKSGKDGKTIGQSGATALSDTYLVNAREVNMQRHADIISWVGELYGVRGLESRYAYAYIDDEGVWQDVRGEEAGYKAMSAFHAFYEEGLVFIGKPSDGKKAKQSYYSEGTIESMAEHDYLNTQTPAGFKVSGDTDDATYSLEDGYNYTANITAVSKWDEDGDGTIQSDEYFRFTESWRSVKDSGIAVPLDSVKNDPKKLSAVLTFIDYIFSEDGQIVMAYGQPASDANGTGGFWYNPEVATEGAQTVEGVNYKGTFRFNGKIYASNTYYGKKYVPTLTKKTLDAYVGKSVNGYTFGGAGTGSSESASSKWTQTGVVMSYTDFARGVMGSAVNFGNKLTSLEYQMTSEMGRRGAEKVDVAVSADIIRHVTPSLSTYTYSSKWYSVVPTALPFTVAETATTGTLLKDCNDLYNKGSAGTIFTINKNTETNLYLEIIQKGYAFGSYNDMFAKLGLSE